MGQGDEQGTLDFSCTYFTVFLKEYFIISKSLKQTNPLVNQ